MFSLCGIYVIPREINFYKMYQKLMSLTQFKLCMVSIDHTAYSKAKFEDYGFKTSCFR
jgi:hypothetical protein